MKMKNIYLFYFLLFLPQLCYCQKSNFILLDKKYNSDINYTGINKINDIGEDSIFRMDSIFGFKKSGNFTVYRFTRKIKNVKIENSKFEKDSITDLIILKTNKKNKIIDGFFYRLEWGELPNDCILLRTKCNLLLIENLSIKDLLFKLVRKKYGTNLLDKSSSMILLENKLKVLKK